jgi:hypothetical protein
MLKAVAASWSDGWNNIWLSAAVIRVVLILYAGTLFIDVSDAALVDRSLSAGAFSNVFAQSAVLIISLLVLHSSPCSLA